MIHNSNLGTLNIILGILCSKVKVGIGNSELGDLFIHSGSLESSTVDCESMNGSSVMGLTSCRRFPVLSE